MSEFESKIAEFAYNDVITCPYAIEYICEHVKELERQMAEEKVTHDITFKCSVDYQNAYEDVKKQLEEASNTIKRIKNLANQYYDQRSEYEEKEVEVPYWDIINALELKAQG